MKDLTIRTIYDLTDLIRSFGDAIKPFVTHSHTNQFIRNDFILITFFGFVLDRDPKPHFKNELFKHSTLMKIVLGGGSCGYFMSH